jgi:hypothetical protein
MLLIFWKGNILLGDDLVKEMKYLNQLKISISNYAIALASITKINERMTLFDSKWKDHLIYTLLRTALFGFKGKQ